MLEHPPQLNITQSELAPRVADYFDNLLAQRDAILASYDLTPETAEKFCDVQSTDKDREKILALYERMVYVLEHKQIPSSELLEQARIKEQHRINEFFGEDAHIEVPPLPETITSERIEQWKQKRFELRYLPPLILKENDNYPGWKKKPTRGINLFKNLTIIEELPENRDNPHLVNLAPNQLPGCWMLIDTRPKPNHFEGIQSYEEDKDIQNIIWELAYRQSVNPESQAAKRFYIHPSVFSSYHFWHPFYEYFGISLDEAVIRLPRLIEQSMFGQGEDWDGTTALEVAEEYYHHKLRLVSGNSSYGGASHVGWSEYEDSSVGFRPLVVFHPPILDV